MSGNRPAHCVLMVGLDGAGKTTTLQSLARGMSACEKPQLNTLPTLSYSVDELKWRRERLLVWDVGGQDKLRNLWRHFYSHVSCLVFVLDSNDRQRFSEAREELRLLLAAPQLAQVPLLLLANKQDLNPAASLAEIENVMQLSVLVLSGSSRPVRLLPMSAWNGNGLNAAMDWIGEQCAAGDTHRDTRPQLVPSNLNDRTADFEFLPRGVSQRCNEQQRRKSSAGSRRQHRRGSTQ